ncbi:hypothetical protein GCM10023175_61040 [Pseudonocardia xishanensis]|uniref:Uncharacterized protein n=1 Tax=Pseudonocardia xishanensis TaxID=630995 RepID=A0ABP8S2H1_9PSEU
MAGRGVAEVPGELERGGTAQEGAVHVEDVQAGQDEESVLGAVGRESRGPLGAETRMLARRKRF